MSEQVNLSSTIRETGFPMVIAITALVLALVSGIVNYRQNNLADIESGLRDTRDQLQLAKNDIADMKARTLQQLVEAELAIRNRDKLLDEKDELIDQLNDANGRIKELENQVRALDRSLEKKKLQLAKAAKKVAATKPGKSSVKKKPASKKATTAKTTTVKKIPEIEKTLTAKEKTASIKQAASPEKTAAVKNTANKETKADAKAATAENSPAKEMQTVLAEEVKASPASADLDIYTRKIAPSLQQSIGNMLAKSGFRAKFPERRASMKMTNATTVFYYNKGYKAVAEQLVKELSELSNSKVILRKGASPFSKNKIIVHIIAD